MSNLRPSRWHLFNAVAFTSTAIAIVTFSLLGFGCRSVGPSGNARSDAQPSPTAAPSPRLAAGAYFGLKLPGETPELFAPGIVNLPNRSVGRIAFSPDATECAFTVFEGFYANNRILYTRYESDAWTPQTPFPSVDGRKSLEPLFSRDNSRLYFTVRAAGDSPNGDFWEAQRSAEGWSEPQPLSVALNSTEDEFCLTQTADGTMYFASRRAGGHGGLDLYRAIARPGQSLEVENLGTPVNFGGDDGDPALSPDGRVLVFYSASLRPRAAGNSDLFVCFDNGKGGWTTPVNLGERFNTPAHEYAATFSHDGRELFFVRFDGKKGDVYWVSATALETFRQQSEAAGAVPESEVESAPERKPVHVLPEILRRYVGTYVMDAQPDVVNHISLEADQVLTQMAGQPKVPLFPESETEFFLKVVDAQVEFVMNDEGVVTHLVARQNGMDFKMTRKSEGLSPLTTKP